jgi:hypothetical protein
MDEHTLLAGGDDGTFVPFTDMLFNVLLGFAFMVFTAFALISPTAKTGAVDLKAEFIIAMNWPDNNPNDMDIYVEDPAGNVVWYHSKEAGLMHLDRDDRGDYKNTITVNGKTIRNPIRQEIVTLRGIIPGEYVVNVNEFMQTAAGKVPVSVKIEKLNPTATVVYYGTHDFDHKGQEETYIRFTVDGDGQVTDLNTRPKSLVRAVRTPSGGNAPRQVNN